VSGKIGGRGVSKAQWLDRGLEALSEGDVSALTIEGLARSLGIARAGFYWHFKGRDDLLKQLLNHWIAETTAVVTADERLLALDPKARLARAAERIVDHDLGRYEMAIRQWALAEAQVMRAVRKVYRLRLEFARGAFGELGFGRRAGDADDAVRLLPRLGSVDLPGIVAQAAPSIDREPNRAIDTATMNARAGARRQAAIIRCTTMLVPRQLR